MLVEGFARAPLRFTFYVSRNTNPQFPLWLYLMQIQPVFFAIATKTRRHEGAQSLCGFRGDVADLHNVAADPAYTQIKKNLWNQVIDILETTGDPRVRGQGDVFDMQPYSGGIVRARGM